ncbi:MAG: hypothetical protein KC619_16205 [Myxococcales bacterium]|nr:hypothetical protein [Myxococcales bacterium]
MTYPNQSAKRLHHWLIRMAGDGSGRVSLGHMNVTGPGVPLGQWAVKNGDSDETLRQLSAAILGAASDDADGQSSGTPQQYVTLYYLDDEPDRAVSRLPFRLATAEQFAPEGSTLASEPANERGLLGQAIRHNEFLVRTSFGAMGSAAAQLERHNHMLSDQLVRLTEQVFDMQKERQDLLDRDTERLLEVERFEAERDHRDRMTSELLSAIKGGFAMLTNGGKPLQLPASTTPASAPQLPADTMTEVTSTEASMTPPPTVPAAAMVALSQLQDLFRSLTPEQTQQIASILTPMQQASLFSLYQLFAGLEETETAEGELVED